MIELPSRLATLLGRDRALEGVAKLVLAKYDLILQWSNLPFFPEYTDHGPKHLSDVLSTSSDLISTDAWDVLTPEDATGVILSTLFHDLGMHIAEDGFFALTDRHNDTILIPSIDTQPWPTLWETFMLEAKRFDQKERMRIFGDNLPIEVPARQTDLLTERDRKLIGEFIRRHHPRLAHEFALFGFQGASKRLNVMTEADHNLLDLCGLIARSHGSGLRRFLPYLERHYSRRVFNGMHPVFLMALLRVSDYLQIQAERAPAIRLDIQAIRSPFSLREWRTHGAVADVSQYHDDPESIYVRTRASNTETYLKLGDLMNSLQYELDSCWAVLGEVYGRFPPLNKLGFVLRRIRSDLDETNTEMIAGGFVKNRFSFESAGAELLKIFAEPLYGVNPNFSMRELIQNAVDSVLEMRALAEKDGYVIPTFQQEADVVVSLSGSAVDGYTLRISDKGVGMNQDVVQNYFLRAGASYRRSAEWQEDFLDSDGHSRVLRSGRFGIGILAAFILGPVISVKTRHYSEPIGLSFSAALETDPIDVRYFKMPVGTEIEIEISSTKSLNPVSMFTPPTKKQYGALPDHLYVLSRPSMQLLLNGQRVKRGEQWPACGEDPLPQGWRRIKSDSNETPSLMAQAFGEDIGTSVIPYNLEDRKRLPGYEILRSQVDFHASRIVSKHDPSS